MVVDTERVNFFDTDAMAVVHHANYIRWFERGRVEYMRRAGVELNDIMEAGYVFPITKVECNYKNSAKFDDIVEIRTKMTAVSRAKMDFDYDIVRASDELLLAYGSTRIVFTKMETGKIARLPDIFFKKLENFRIQEEKVND